MPRENEPPKPPQNHDKPENPAPPQRRKAEDSSQKERQGLMEYSEKDEERVVKHLAKLIIEGDRNDEIFFTDIILFLRSQNIDNPFPLFTKLLDRLTPDQALAFLSLRGTIEESRHNDYTSKVREKIKSGTSPQAILRYSYVLRRLLSQKEAEKMVKKALFLLQTSDPNGKLIIFKYLGELSSFMEIKELEKLAKDTLEEIMQSGKAEEMLQAVGEGQFIITDYLDQLILQYTEKAVAMLVSQGRGEEVFNYARNYQDSFQFARMVPMRQIFGPVIIDVLKNPSEKIYKNLMSAPDYYLDLSFMDRTEFENVLYDTALKAAQDRDLLRLLFDRAGILRKFLGDKTQDIWEECEKTDQELFDLFGPGQR